MRISDWSSDVCSSDLQLLHLLGREKMEELFRDLGFDGRPHIELKERAFPLWPKSWGRVTTMTASYGNGLAVTPLHLASAYAALVHGGSWRHATLPQPGAKAPTPHLGRPTCRARGGEKVDI